MEEKIKELQNRLMTKRPESWEFIPDIDLYMDQIAAYMTRQHIGLEEGEEETLTSAMINNYIKSGVMPRANGKKYNKDHIVYLTAICLLKQVVSVSDAGTMLAALMEEESTENFYGEYTEIEDRELTRAAELIKGTSSRGEAARMALELAISSYAQKYACKKLIEMLKDEQEDEMKEEPKKPKKAKKYE